MKYSEKLKDPRWQKKRLEIFERDNFTCQYCNTTEIELNVHHLQYQRVDPWDYDDSFLITLCRNCHEEEEFLKGFAKSSIEYLTSLGFLYLDIRDIIMTISKKTDSLNDKDRSEYFKSLKQIIIEHHGKEI